MKLQNMKFMFSFIFFISINSYSQTVLTVSEFERAINKKDIQLLDVRTKEEFNEGHIAYADHANWYNEKEFLNKISQLDKSKSVYVYCYSGVRSNNAAKLLTSKGFIVFDLKGGISNWILEHRIIKK